MSALYPPTQHVLLSEDALALDDLHLDAQALTAEMVLGLVGTSYTGDALERVLIAVARQVNLQVEIDGNHRDPNVSQETHGSETWIYRGGTYLDPLAVQIVDDLAEEALGDEAEGEFRAITSFR